MAIREEVARAALEGIDWRDTITRLRPHTPEIWKRLPVAERAKFMRWLMPYWDVHRHRLAPTAHRRVTNMIERGNVEIVAGRIRSYEVGESDVQVTVAMRGARSERTLTVKKVVNCTGPMYDLSRVEHPLVRQLLCEGHLRQDPLQIGFEVSPEYGVIGASGEASGVIRYVGPMLKAMYWESIAVPELRGHARKLAELLVSRCASHSSNEVRLRRLGG